MTTLFSESKPVRRGLLTSGAALAAGVACLLAAIPSFSHVDDSALLLFPGLLGGWLLGTQLSLWRLRFFPLLVASTLAYAGGAVLLSSVRDLIWLAPLAFGFFVAAVAAFCFLTPRLEVVALWLPLSLCAGASIGWLNHHHVVEVWRTDKLAMWDGPSSFFLACGVVFFVASLAARRRIAVERWLHKETRVTSVRRTSSSTGAVLLTAVLLGSALLVPPFLLRSRSARACEDGDVCTKPPATASSAPAPPSAEPARHAPPELDARAVWATLVRLRDPLVFLLQQVALGAALLLGALLAARPLLRRRRLRELEQPALTTTPTARVQSRFARCLVALEEAGVPVDGALLAPRELMATSAAWLGEPPIGLSDAVDVWERVCFGGRGLPDDAEAHMARAMDLVVAWSRTSTPVWRSLLLAFRLPTVG
jgi:hypothetical protein